jgi:hypothetical protein
MIPHRHGSFFVERKTWESNPLGAHLHMNSVPATKADSLPELHPTFPVAGDDRSESRRNDAFQFTRIKDSHAFTVIRHFFLVITTLLKSIGSPTTRTYTN